MALFVALFGAWKDALWHLFAWRFSGLKRRLVARFVALEKTPCGMAFARGMKKTPCGTLRRSLARILGLEKDALWHLLCFGA